MPDDEQKPSRLARFFGFSGKADKPKVDEATSDDKNEELVSPAEQEPAPASASFKNKVEGASATSGAEQHQVDGQTAAESAEHIHADINASEPSATEVALERDITLDITDDRQETTSQESSGEVVQEKPKNTGLFGRWRKGLQKTRQTVGTALTGLLRHRSDIDDELIEELETQLLMADVGLETTRHVIGALQQRIKKQRGADVDLYDELRLLLVELLNSGDTQLNMHPGHTNVLMVVGVNGVGKTTTIGKLAKQLKSEGKSVVLAAGDTFRAAAVEQLQVWGERNDVHVVAQSTGSDSASVVYDAMESARAKSADLVIADTAGRLHNKSNLMDELNKVVRVIQKLDNTAPHETLLVLDACTGQNALNQAREFAKAVPLTGIILTKMDGTAKGGVIFSLAQQTGLPVKYVGLGEGIDDLARFDPEQFVNALLPAEG